MPGFSPTTSFITADQYSSSTQQFLRSSALGSLTATLYELPGDQTLLENAGRVILNAGNIDSAQAEQRLSYQQKLQDAGVDTRLFSAPEAERRLHAKTYTAIVNNQVSALITSGNLTQSSLSSVPNSQAERVQQSIRQGNLILQKNLAIQTTDPSLVRQIAQFQREASSGRVPHSGQNVLVGGQASSVTVDRLLKARAGDRVVLTSPYLNDPQMVAALLTARTAGASVTVISSDPQHNNPIATGGGPEHGTALAQLALGGVTVLTPGKDDPLLIHTKGLAIVNQDGRSSFFLGSHNFTVSAKQDQSVDMLLLLNDQGMALKLANELEGSAQTMGLKRYQPNSGITMNRIEQRMQLLGTGRLYKVQTPTRDPLRPTAGTDALPVMPYYPTKMDSKFFDYFIGKDLPEVAIYSDLWKARTGQTEVPEAIKRMDREMSDPGLGNLFNRIVGQKVYEEGFGFIGSALTSAGRFIDWALGAEEYQEDKKERDGAYAGSMRKLMGLEYQQDGKKGPFEAVFGNLYTLTASTAQTLAFYVGVDLPFKYAKAAFESDYTHFLLQLPGETRSRIPGLNTIQSGSAFRYLMFGSSIANPLNEIMADPATTRENFANRLYDRLVNQTNVRKDLSRVAKTQEGRLTQIELGDEGLYAVSKTLRQFDLGRFQNLTRPILEAINPYRPGKHFYDLYQKSLDSLEETIGQGIVVEFRQAKDNPSIYEPAFRHIGTERVTAVAKRYDEIAALMPANLFYWAPPLRRMLGLEEFDPTQHMTIRDFVSFEDAVKWTEGFYHQATTLLRNPAEALHKTATAWRNEFNLIKAERQAAAAIQTSGIPKIPNLRSDTAEALEDLYAFTAQTYKTHAAELTALLNDQRFQTYAAALKEQHKLLEQSPFRTLGSSASARNPYKSMDSEAGRRISNLRSAMSRAGIFLLADQLADKFLFQNLGANLFTQIQAHDELSTRDGSVARFSFTGTLPREGVIALQIGVGLTTGFLLPDIVDKGQRPGGILSRYQSLRPLQEQITAQEQAIRAAAADPAMETLELLNLRSAAGAEAKSYRRVFKRLNSTTYRRIGLRFNTTAALAAAFFSGFAAKGLAMGAAYALNLIHNRDNGVTLNSTDGYFSAMFERLTVDEIGKAQTREDYANIALGETLANSFLRQSRDGTRIYSVASQMTTPFFQIPLVMRMDTGKHLATFSIGFQLIPLTGIGLTPLLPFALKLSNDETQSATEKMQQLRPDLFSPIEMAAMGARGLISTLTFGSGLTYEKDSVYEQGMQFVGLSTALTLGASRLYESSLRARLAESVGDSHSLIRQFDDIERNTRALRKVIGGAMEFTNKSLRFLYGMPFMFASATATGLRKVLPENKQMRLPGVARRLAPYYLALTMARLMSNPDGGYVGQDYSNPFVQLQATLGAGLLTGHLLDRAGVFASSEELAADFHTAMARRGQQQVETYRTLFADWLPRPQATNQALVGEVDEVLQAITEMKGAARGNRMVVSRRLLGAMASPVLWEEGIRQREVKLLSYHEGDPLRGKQIGTQSKQVLSKLPYGNLKSMGARIALAGLVVGGLKGLAFTVASFMSPEMLDSVYRVPLLGPTLRLLAGVESKKDKLHDLMFAGVKQADQPRGIVGLLDRAARILSFGTFGLVKASGLYSDSTDPFLNIAGPFGATFKPNRIGTYVQYATSFSDISASAYNMVQGSVSADLIMRTLGTLRSGKASTLAEAIAKLRGATPRKSNATYEALTPYELEAASRSSGIARSLRIRNFRMQHYSGQRASEQYLDFLKEGYAFGILGHDALPGYRLPSDGYRPLSHLQQVDFFIQHNDLETPQFKVFDPEKNIMDWYAKTEWRSRTLMQGFSALSVGVDLQSMPGTAAIFAPLSFLTIGAGVYSAVELVGGLAAFQAKDELRVLMESSLINQGKNVSDPLRYAFTTGTLPDSRRSAIFQISKSNRVKDVFRLSLDVEQIAIESGELPGNIARQVSKQYMSLHGGLSKYLANQYTRELRTLLASTVDSTEGLAAEQKAIFREQVTSSLRSIVEKGFTRRLVAKSKTTLFEAFTGSSDSLSAYLDDVQELSARAIDDVLAGADEVVGKGLQTEQIHKGVLTLNVRLENSEAFKTLINKVQEPLIGRYDIRADRQAARRELFKRYTGLTPEDAMRAEGSLQVRTRPKLPNTAVGEIARPWSEGALTTSFKSLKATGQLAASWTAVGRSVYELVESGAVLLGGKTQNPYMRRLAGEQFVTSAATWGISSVVAAIAMGLGTGPLLGLGLAVGAMFGLDYMKSKIAPVRRAEKAIVGTLADLISRPVETVGRVFDPIGLGAPVRAVGNLIATPASFLLSVATAPVRYALENLVAPILQEQYYTLPKDSAPVQMVKSLLLPSSVYARFEFTDGRSSTLAGREPFLTGNAAMALKQRQLDRIQRSISASTDLESDFVYGTVLGRPVGTKEQLLNARYMEGYSGVRILQPFGLQTYRVSTTLRMALERRQALFNASVTAAAISRPPAPVDLKVLSLMYGSAATLGYLQRSDTSTNIFSRLRQDVTEGLGTTTRLVRSSLDTVSQFINGWTAQAMPEWMKRLNGWVGHQALQTQRRFRALKYLGGKRLRGMTPKFGLPDIFNPMRNRFSAIAERVNNLAAGLGARAGRVLSGSLDFGIAALDRVSAFFGGVSRWISKLPRLALSLGRGSSSVSSESESPSALSRLMTKLSSWWTGLRGGINPAELEVGGTLSRSVTQELGKVRGLYRSIGRWFGQTFSRPLFNLTLLATPRLLGRIPSALGKVAQYAPVGLLTGLELLTAYQADQRLKSLNRSSSFKEYRQAYQETSIGVSSFVVGGFLAAMGANPLTSLAGAVAGGLLVGSPVGDALARRDYEKSRNPVMDYIQQSLMVGTAINLAQAPKLARLGTVGAIRRALLNYAFSFGTGSLGPMMQLSVTNGISHTYHWGVNNRVRLGQWRRTTRSFLSTLPETTRFLFSGRSSQAIAQAGTLEVESMIQRFLSEQAEAGSTLTRVRHRFTTGRFEMAGDFNIRSGQVRLTGAVQNTLGRARSGLFVQGESLARARFTVLHELSHAVELKGGIAQLGIQDLERFAREQNLNSAQLTQIVERLSEVSTYRNFYRRQHFNAASVERVFADEISANVRAIQTFAVHHPQELSRLIQSLDAQTRHTNLKGAYQELLAQGAEFKGTPIEPRYRYSRTMLKQNRPAGGIRLGQLAFAGYIAADVMYGYHTSSQYKVLNRQVAEARRTGGTAAVASLRRQIQETRNEQYGAVSGTLLGSLAGLVTRNLWASLAIGVGSTVVLPALGFLGLTRRQADQDYQNALEGHAIDSLVQSPSFYVRANQEFLPQVLVAQQLFATAGNTIRRTLAQIMYPVTSLVRRAASAGGYVVAGLSGAALNLARAGYETALERAEAVAPIAYRNAQTVVRQVSQRTSGTVQFVSQGGRQLLTQVSGQGARLMQPISRLASRTGKLGQLTADGLVKSLYTVNRGAAERVLSLGYRDTFFSAIGPAMDLYTFGSGVNKALQLNAYSSLAEVEEAYTEAGAGQGGLVGSVVGVFAGGVLGDFAGSFLGQVLGAESAKEKALQRYRAKDYGLVPVLEDMVQPLLRETAIAASVGKGMARVGQYAAGKYTTGMAARLAAGKANHLDRIVRATSVGYRKGLQKLTQEAAGRFSRVLGKVPGKNEIAQLASRTPGYLGRAAGRLVRFAGPAIDVARLGVGLYQTAHARNQAEYEVGVQRSTGAVGSLVGGAVGGFFGGPLGAIAGSIAGDFIFSQVGKHLGKMAYEHRVSGTRVVTGQVAGGMGGLILGGIGAGLLVAAGIATLPVALSVAAVVGLAGFVGGGYASLIGSHKQQAAVTGPVVVNRQRQPLLGQQLGADNAALLKVGRERVSTAQTYLLPEKKEAEYSPLNNTELKPLEQGVLRAARQPLSNKPWWQQVGDGFGSAISGVVGAFQRMAQGFQQVTTRFLDQAKRMAAGVKAQLTGGGAVTPMDSVDGGSAIGSLLPAAAAATGSSYLRVTKTDQKDQYGNTLLTMQLIGAKGEVLDQLPVVSGVRGRQNFRTANQSVAGSMESVPEGVYSLGQVQWAGGKGNMNASFGSGLGPMWVSVDPRSASGRGNIGIHLDANRSYAPGTAGCIGLIEADHLKKVDGWFDKYGPRTLIVDYGLGTVPKSYATSGSVRGGQGQSSTASTTFGPGIGRITPFEVWSLGGREFGERQVKDASQLLPHWHGTSGYVRYHDDDHGHNSSYLDNGLRVVDIALERNGSNQVYVPSPVAGTVVTAGFGEGGLGVIAIRDASDVVHRVLHNKTIDVKVGQQVRYGQALGIQGSTGTTSTAVHVHLETTQANLNRFIHSLVTGDFYGGKEGQSLGSVSAGASGQGRANSQLGSVKAGAAGIGSFGPSKASAGASRVSRLSQTEAIRLATISILEAPTRMGRLDVAQVIFNRMNAPKVGAAYYGGSVGQVAFAPKQFEPFFGVSPSEVQTKEDAIRMLQQKRGYSRQSAEAMINNFFLDISDPAKMSDACRHVGGRTEFKGTTMQRFRVAAEDPQRGSNENFFHITKGQTYGQLNQLARMGPDAIVVDGVTTNPAAGTSDGTENQPATIQSTTPASASFDQFRSRPGASSAHRQRASLRRASANQTFVTAQLPIADVAALKQASRPTVNLKTVATYVQYARAEAQRVAKAIEQKRAARPGVAIQINVNNPKSEALSSIANADTARAPQTSRILVARAQANARTTIVEVEDTTFYRNHWESATGMPPQSDYALMDTGLV